MRGELGTDRRDIIERQYADDRNLAARQSIYAYQRPRLDLFARALELAGLCGDEHVLDVGCGNGRYLSELRARRHRGPVCGLDLSQGMLRSVHRPAGPLLVGDAQALPFATGSFDVALAMHMLYHVPDRRAAIAELGRVVRPGGIALVLTNSDTHLRELDDLLDVSARAVGVDAFPRRSSVSFTVQSGGPELEAAFDTVVARQFASWLVVDQVAPIVAYARSMGAFVADTDGALDVVIGELARRVENLIAANGAFRTRTAVGCFVCR